MNIEELKYKEVKSMMAEIIQAISKSKDKVWQLLGVFFAMQAFLITDIFTYDYISLKSLMFFMSIPFSVFFYKKCKSSLFPSAIALDGMTLDIFYDGDKITDITLYYDRCIVQNGIVLSAVVDGYKTAFKCFLNFLIASTVLSGLFFAFQISKCI